MYNMCVGPGGDPSKQGRMAAEGLGTGEHTSRPLGVRRHAAVTTDTSQVLSPCENAGPALRDSNDSRKDRTTDFHVKSQYFYVSSSIS